MAEPVRVGVIGTSWYADLAHLPRVKSHPRAELAAICGRNRTRAGEIAAKYDIPFTFTNYREMIEKVNLDAVIISTPDDLHYPMTMDTLDASLHVLCEKPMALNAEQAKEMYEKYVARPGPEGQILNTANDAASLVIEFESGTQGIIELSAVTHTPRGQEQYIRLYGQSGTLLADQSSIEGEIRGARENEKQLEVLSVPDELWRDVDRTQSLRRQVLETFLKQPVADRQFIDAILDDRPIEPNFYDGLQAQRVIDAAMQSHQQGTQVSL